MSQQNRTKNGGNGSRETTPKKTAKSAETPKAQPVQVKRQDNVVVLSSLAWWRAALNHSVHAILAWTGLIIDRDIDICFSTPQPLSRGLVFYSSEQFSLRGAPWIAVNPCIGHDTSRHGEPISAQDQVREAISHILIRLVMIGVAQDRGRELSAKYADSLVRRPSREARKYLGLIGIKLDGGRVYLDPMATGVRDEIIARTVRGLAPWFPPAGEYRPTGYRFAPESAPDKPKRYALYACDVCKYRRRDTRDLRHHDGAHCPMSDATGAACTGTLHIVPEVDVSEWAATKLADSKQAWATADFSVPPIRPMPSNIVPDIGGRLEKHLSPVSVDDDTLTVTEVTAHGQLL